MRDEDKATVSKLLDNSTKAEVIAWLTEHIGDADKVLIVCGTHNDKTNGLDLNARQMGFKYLYELQGFTCMTADFFADEEVIEDGD